MSQKEQIALKNISDLNTALQLSAYPNRINGKINSLIEWRSCGFVKLQKIDEQIISKKALFCEDGKLDDWLYVKKIAEDGFCYFKELYREMLTMPFYHQECGSLLFPLTNGLNFKIIYSE